MAAVVGRSGSGEETSDAGERHDRVRLAGAHRIGGRAGPLNAGGRAQLDRATGPVWAG